MKLLGMDKKEQQILLGIPVLFLLGFAVHFLYELSGRQMLVGFFAPVNESVWEHLKLVLWPMLLWWAVYYIRVAQRREIDASAWFMGAFLALISAQSSIVLLFYFLQGAFGVESVIADIIIFFLAVLLGQCVGLRQYHRGSSVSWMVPLLLIMGLLVLSIVFTLVPPDAPLFRDPNTGLRGIFAIS